MHMYVHVYISFILFLSPLSHLHFTSPYLFPLSLPPPSHSHSPSSPLPSLFIASSRLQVVLPHG